MIDHVEIVVCFDDVLAVDLVCGTVFGSIWWDLHETVWFVLMHDGIVICVCFLVVYFVVVMGFWGNFDFIEVVALLDGLFGLAGFFGLALFIVSLVVVLDRIWFYFVVYCMDQWLFWFDSLVMFMVAGHVWWVTADERDLVFVWYVAFVEEVVLFAADLE